ATILFGRELAHFNDPGIELGMVDPAVLERTRDAAPVTQDIPPKRDAGPHRFIGRLVTAVLAVWPIDKTDAFHEQRRILEYLGVEVPRSVFTALERAKV